MILLLLWDEFGILNLFVQKLVINVAFPCLFVITKNSKLNFVM